jgi:hypothetical protein
LADTDFEAYKGQFEEQEKLKLEKERKQREFKKLSNDIDFEDFEDDYVDTGSSFKRTTSIFNPTFLVLCGLGLYFLYIVLGKPRRITEKDLE